MANPHLIKRLGGIASLQIFNRCRYPVEGVIVEDNSIHAFPGTGVTPDGRTMLHRGGMSLRDYFAGQAIIGILSNPSVNDAKQLSESAFKVADEMIRERENG